MALIHIGDGSLRNQLWYASWMLSFIGINIFDEKWMKGWRIFMHTGIILSYCVLSLYISIFSFPAESFLNFGKGLYDVFPLFFLASTISEIIIITWTIYYRKDILKLVETAHREIALHSEKEKNVYIDSMKDVNKIFVAYSLTMLTGLVCYMVNLVMSKDAITSIPMLLPVGLVPIDESPNYEIVLSIFEIRPFLSLMCRCGFLMTYTSLVGNCCCQFKVLTCRMEHLIREMANPEVATHHIKKILESTVYSHCLLLSSVSKLREIYQLILASNMCFLMTYLIRSLVVRSIYTLELLAPPFLLLFIYSYISERLNSERENFQKSIYASEWYSTSTFHRKNLFIITLMASKSTYLTIAKMSDISLKTFQSALNFCYSAYALIKSKYTSALCSIDN